ncbi:hypothetical protein ACWGMW_29860 [Streptomyces albidoflavus]
MARILVPGPDGRLAGWFEQGSAEAFSEERERRDSFTLVSVNTGSEHWHETLFRTAGGRWVLCGWGDDADARRTYRFVDGQAEALPWLLLNRWDEAAGELFDVPEESGPPVASEAATAPVRLPEALLGRVGALAERQGRDMPDVLVDLLGAALRRSQA